MPRNHLFTDLILHSRDDFVSPRANANVYSTHCCEARPLEQHKASTDAVVSVSSIDGFHACFKCRHTCSEMRSGGIFEPTSFATHGSRNFRGDHHELSTESDLDSFNFQPNYLQLGNGRTLRMVDCRHSVIFESDMHMRKHVSLHRRTSRCVLDSDQKP